MKENYNKTDGYRESIQMGLKGFGGQSGCEYGLRTFDLAVAHGLMAEQHAHAEFGVVFEGGEQYLGLTRAADRGEPLDVFLYNRVEDQSEDPALMFGCREAAGVKSENIKKAKELMNQVASNYELRLLERKQLELQINKYILDGPEKYLKQIDEMFDKIGAIEAAIMKERLIRMVRSHSS